VLEEKKNGAAFLTHREVLQIREKYQKGVSQRNLAAEFGVTESAIRNIVTGRTWEHIGGPISRRCTREEMRGEGNPCAKLTVDTVEQIREKRQIGYSIPRLASEFAMSEGAIYNIVTGRTWKHVGGPVESHSGKRKAR